MRSLAKANGEIRSICLLGYADALRWTQTDKALEVSLPAEPRGQYAHVLKALAVGSFLEGR